VTDRSTAVATRDDSLQATIAWLEDEFPGWEVSLDATSSWHGELRPLWVARQTGRHPQAELTPAKLHTRLSDYHDREARRRALAN
jgi:hypothetical protein